MQNGIGRRDEWSKKASLLGEYFSRDLKAITKQTTRKSDQTIFQYDEKTSAKTVRQEQTWNVKK